MNACDNLQQCTELLFCAIVVNNVRLAAGLLAKRCLVLYTIEDISLVTLAIKCGHAKILESMLEESVRVEANMSREGFGDMPFRSSASGQKTIIQMILSHVDVDIIQE